MAGSPDIQIVVGNTGGASPSEGSAALIRNNLQAALGVHNPVYISVAVNQDSINQLRAQIESALSGIVIGGTTAGTSAAAGTTPIVPVSGASTAAIETASHATTVLTQQTVQLSGALDEERLRHLQASNALKEQIAAENLGAATARRSKAESQAKTAVLREQIVQQNAAAAAERATGAATTQVAAQTAQARLQLQKFNTYLRTLKPAALTEFSVEIARIRQGLGSGIPAEVQKARIALTGFQAEMQRLGYEGGNTFTLLTTKLKQYASYFASSMAIMALYSGFRNIITTVKELDDALTDLRIVTGGTKQETEELLETYNQMARQLGTTTAAVAEAAVEWQRQGYSVAETNQLIQTSMMLSVVGMVDSAEAAQYLTSAMKGYQVEASNAIDIVDRLTSVDLVAAVSAGGLAEAMARTANSARLAGVDMNHLVGYIAAVGEVTQRDMSTVGEAFKTMFARYGNVKLGVMTDEESGENLNDFEKVLDSVGIKLREQNGQFRDFDDVMVELANSWKTLSDVEQSAVASTLGGMRQRENVLVLLENMETALKYAGVAANSTGTALQKFSVYEESVEYKTNQLSASADKFATTFLDSGLYKGVLDLGIGLMDLATGIFSLGGALDGAVGDIALLGTALITLTSVIKMLKAAGLGMAFGQTIKGLGATLTYLSMMGTKSVVGLADSFAVLNEQQIVRIALNKTMSKSDLFATLQQAGLTREQRKNIATQLEQAGATGASTAATGAMAGAQSTATGTTWSLTAAMRGLGAVMKAHPILSFLTIAVIAVPLVVKAFDWLTTSLEEQRQKLSDAKQAYDDTVSSLEDVESELEQVQARMAELNKLNSPTLVEQAELNKLKLTNEELEREVALLEREKQLKQAELEKQGVNTLKYKSSRYTGSAISFEGVRVDTSDQMSDTEYLQFIVNTLPRLQAQRANALEQAEKALAEGNQAAYSIWSQEAIDLQNTYDTLLSEGGDVARSIQDTTSSMAGTTAESRALKQEGEAVVDAWLSVTESVVSVQEKVEEAALAAKSFESIVSSIKPSMSALADAQEDMADTGYLSSDSIAALKAAGLDKYLVACTNGYKLANGALNNYLNTQKQAYQEAVTTAKTAAQQVFENEGKKALAINATTAAYLTQLKAIQAEKKAALAGGGRGTPRQRAELDELYHIIKDLETAQANYDELIRGIGTVKLETSTKKTDANKSAFEEEYAKQKHQLELGKKTLKEFNDWLAGDKGYKYYFKNQKDYAEEWRKYEKEVFDNSMQLHDQEATNIDHTIEMLKLQNASEQDILDAYRQKQVLLESARDLVYDFLKAQGLSEAQIASNSTFQELSKSLIENKDSAKDFYKERVNQRVADFEHEINMLERLEGQENALIAKYREKQAYLVSIREEYRKTLVAAGNTADEIARDDWFQELTEQIYDLNESVDDVFQNVFDRISGDLNELLDLTKELIQHEKEEQIEALEDQKDAFSDLIDAKKEMLRLTREEQEYNDKVAKSTKDIAKLQSRIDALAMDDTRQAALERAKLEEELAELQKELADTQNDHYITKTEEALDKEEEEYHDLMDSKIKDIENFLDDNEAMTNAALRRLDNANETLFDQLESYAKHYTDTTSAELQNMWDTAMKAAEKYGSFTSSMTMFEESDVQNEAQKIVAQMHHNGDMWASNPDPASRQRYDAANLDLGAQLEELLGITVERINGTWYIGDGANRKKLYEVFGYHTGGVVGDTASISPKADELFALLQDDEIVMSRRMVSNTFDFLTGLPQVMASAFRAPLSLASQAVSGVKEYVLNISAPLTMDGVLPSEEILSTIKQYPRKVAEVVAAQIQKL